MLRITHAFAPQTYLKPLCQPVLQAIHSDKSFYAAFMQLFSAFLHRKEVIQPHLPIRLPCYDFTPVTGFTFGGSFLTVRSPTSGASNSHGVTGGVYKARERIHRGMLIRDYAAFGHRTGDPRRRARTFRAPRSSDAPLRPSRPRPCPSF